MKNQSIQSIILKFVLPNSLLQLGHPWYTSLQSSINHGIQAIHIKPKEHKNKRNAAIHVWNPVFLVNTVSIYFNFFKKFTFCLQVGQNTLTERTNPLPFSLTGIINFKLSYENFLEFYF